METIAERYRLIRRLGSGGMAEVWLAEQVGPRDFVRRTVVKRIHAHLADDEKFLRAFEDEARLAARLHHPNIVRIEDFGEDAGSLYLVMEYVGRWDLRSLCNLSHGAGFILPLRLVLQVGAQTCEALHYAHESKDAEGKSLGIVHRDVSPQNIMLTDAGQAKLLDFGIAKAASNRDKTRTGMLKGKLAYLSPEQASGGDVDPRTDQYALGIVLFELLAQVRLFASDSEISTFRKVTEARVPDIRALCPEIPESVAEVIARGLQREPDKRYKDCRAFGRALEEEVVAAGGPFTAEEFAAFISRLEHSESMPHALPYLSDDARLSGEKPVIEVPDTDDQSTLYSDLDEAEYSRTEPDARARPTAEPETVITEGSGSNSQETITLFRPEEESLASQVLEDSDETRVADDGLRVLPPEPALTSPAAEQPARRWVYPVFITLLAGLLVFMVLRRGDDKQPAITAKTQQTNSPPGQKEPQPKPKADVPPEASTTPNTKVPTSPSPSAQDRKPPSTVRKVPQRKPVQGAKKTTADPPKPNARKQAQPVRQRPKRRPASAGASRLSKDDLDSLLFSNFQQILDCQSRHNGVGRKVKIRLKIQASGRPGILGIEGAKGNYAACLEQTVSGWRWPRFNGPPQPHIITF